MLKNWQIKYPRVFESFPTIHQELDGSEQQDLCELLQFMDEAGGAFVQESNIYHLMHNTLTIPHYLSNLKESLEMLKHHTPISSELFAFLVSTHHAPTCVKFILRMRQNHLDIPQSLDYLSKQKNLDGLSRAMILVDRSDFGYQIEHLEKLTILSNLLTNPLCQTIFDARLRQFSDFEPHSDPLESVNTSEIIHQCVESTNEDKQIQVFFDYFIQFRPYPPTQKYMRDIDVIDIVTEELQSPEMQALFQKENHLQEIFDAIKYRVAKNVESQDLYSCRTYQDLMTHIWSALHEYRYGQGVQSFFKKPASTESQASHDYKFGK